MLRVLSMIPILLQVSSASAVKPPASMAWRGDVEAALRASTELRQPLLVYLWATWCAPCRMMEETTFRDLDVLAAAESFVRLKIDADAHAAFARKYEIHGLPAILMLDGEGRELLRLEGWVPGAPLATAMLDVSRDYSRYLVDRSTHTSTSLQSAASYLLGLGNQDLASRLLAEALAMAGKDQVVLRESIRLDLAIIELSLNNVETAEREFDQLSESEDPNIRQRALIGLLVSARALKHQAHEHRAASRLARHALGVEIPD